MRAWQTNTLGLAAGIASGIAVSLLAIEMAFSLAIVLLAFSLWSYRRGNRQAMAVAIPAAVAMMTVCFFLPVKELDATVAPMSYRNMTLGEICERLQRDRQIRCRFLDPSICSERVSFSTDGPMPLREVLGKLGRETGTRPATVTCGTGASILCGPHVVMTYYVRLPDGQEARTGTTD